MTSSNIYADELKTTRKTQGFIYEIIGEKEEAYAKIVSYDPNVVRGEKLVIPTAVDGYDVKGFSDYIFQGTSFKYCDLSLFPNLSAGMFCDSQIEEVKLSEGIKKIPDIIFADSQLKKIDIPRSTEIICQRAFLNTKLEEIVIPSGVKNIEYNAFEECNYVKKIVINEGLKELPDRENAFCGAAFETPNLEKLYLPKSIEYISPNEFKESYNQRFVGYIYSEKYPTMTIYAPVGSYAEAYAAEHKIKFEPFDTISEEVISAWAKPEVENAIETGFVPLSFRDNYKRNITRGEFAKLAMFFLSVQYGYPGVPIVKLWSPAEPNDNEYFSREFMNAYCSSRTDRNGSFFTDNNTGEKYSYNNTGEILLPRTPFLDVNENKDLRFIERAYYLGIVNGIGETDFNPDGEITRQEAAAMLMRVYKNYAKTEQTAADFKFADDSDIADWAKEDVYSINSLGIMQGVGENTFAPLDGYTVEQSVATFWRLYDKAPVSRKNKNIEPLLDYEFELENYFKRDDGTCFQEKSRTEFKNFVIVCGFWQQENTNDSDCKLFVFDKNGGVPFISPLTKEMKWEVSSDENVITCYENVEDTFRLYNKLNGTEKVYSAGMYKTDYSVEQGKILNFERVK